MADTDKPRDIWAMVRGFRTSENWAVSLARDILWVAVVVGGIALALYLICGTWPAVVTIESESMAPHMHVGDLVVVVAPDRFGTLHTWEDGKVSGYKKYGDYGDVIIYRPNGITDFWASIGILPLSKQHPIIHRAMTWVDAGQPEPSYLNIYRGASTPTQYIPLLATYETVPGYRILYPQNATQPVNLTSGSRDIVLTMQRERYLLSSAFIVPNSGFTLPTGNITTHGGYISKGDNNPASDQGYLSFPGVGDIQPSGKEWVIGKAYFTIPLVGLIPLHIVDIVIIIIVLMVIHELCLRRKQAKLESPRKIAGKKRK